MNTILLVDDEPQVLQGQKDLLTLHGYAPILATESASEAQRVFDDTEVAMAIVDLTLREGSGLELLRWIRENSPKTVVLIVTGASDLSVAVECMRAGAYDFLVKGSDASRLPGAVRNALAHRDAALENTRLRNALTRSDPENPAPFREFVSVSPRIRQIFVYLEAIAPTPDPVLVTGETGVGKELVARAIHAASGCSGPFIPVNLGGLDDHTISDTLFGHSRGAFTGAQSGREGLVRKAAGGTLFLDEFAEISPETQVKLLRLLDRGEFMPLGSDVLHHSQARLVFATNRDLRRELETGSFRQDLFYRITSHWVQIPSLRERPEDIEPLLNHQVEMHTARLGMNAPALTPEILTAIRSLPMPGNTRELEQLVIAALVNGEWRVTLPERTHETRAENEAGSEVRSLKRSSGAGKDRATQTVRFSNGDVSVAFGERLPTPQQAVEELLREADRRYPNNRAKAAAALGLSPQALSNRWKRIDDNDEQPRHARDGATGGNT